ncbi:ORF-8 (plasmid) [Levilactobacillus brevis]|uniref:ORF-8 n=2 Tax=Levilactobacillus brevis TaxID=1580 RepID=A0A5B7Y3K4_LEVBR|nr:ORF-8 [Levilactobacillus brevis]
MDEKKALKPIDEMLADPWQVDIQELFEASVNEPDEIKKNLYDSLYTYVLQKRQEDIISRPGFVI